MIESVLFSLLMLLNHIILVYSMDGVYSVINMVLSLLS